jgi:hypothetical protein
MLASSACRRLLVFYEHEMIVQTVCLKGKKVNNSLLVKIEGAAWRDAGESKDRKAFASVLEMVRQVSQ